MLLGVPQVVVFPSAEVHQPALPFDWPSLWMKLLDAVYGQDGAEVLDRTVDVHIGRLRDKLGDDADDPRYVATVRGVGYRAAGR